MGTHAARGLGAEGGFGRLSPAVQSGTAQLEGDIMAIDPRLYEKYSGRKGDPRERLGQALIKSDQQRSSIEERRRMARTIGSRWGLLGSVIRLLRLFGS